MEDWDKPGHKEQGFQQPAPKNPAPTPAPTGGLSIYTEYLMLPPPRSLQQLAAKHGLTKVPLEWYERSDSEGWAVAAQVYDDAQNEARIGNNWKAANDTQREVLALTDDLLKDCQRLRKTTDSVAETKDLANAIKTLTTVRLQVLVDLEKPQSNSAVDTPKVVYKTGGDMGPADVRALNLLMWGNELDPYQWKKLNDDVPYPYQKATQKEP